MKFMVAVPFVFMVFAFAAYSQELTPLVTPAKTIYRPKNNPKSDCSPLDMVLDFHVKLDFLMTNGKVATAVVSSTRYDNLVFANEDGNSIARLNYFLRFAAAKDRRILGFIETQPLVTVPGGELANMKSQSFLVRHLIDLPPGNYIADIILRDIHSGCQGANTIRFTIP